MANGNPSVNRSLKDKDFDRIDHALGRPVDPMRETYRNHFAVEIGTRLASSFSHSTHWRLDGAREEMAFYSVTREGRQALAEHLKVIGDPWKSYEVQFNGFATIVSAISSGNAKYQKYLDISDCYPSLSFGKFVREATVRRVDA
ncbi:hypothetical protein [Sinorhizobium americanum]|uniref:Uncharacterized protein n=1 Tax=Sinorhizobium americanum TaxID=194963 RepID=A0A4R2BS39_9HYPH|nr:hypothetical protein [Sinorhizobium americanum]TCN30296.1 hypothetical protein EV184_108170 [Sinorhizobium americanum]